MYFTDSNVTPPIMFRKYTLLGFLTYSAYPGMVENDSPFPKVGYLSSLEGITYV